MTNLRPLVKLPNLKKIVFYINAGSKYDFRPLAKFEQLKTLEIRTPNLAEGYSFLRFPMRKKVRWYGQIVSFFKRLKPARPGRKSFNLDRFGKLKQLESLTIHGFLLENVDALANLRNLESLTLENYPVLLTNRIFTTVKYPEEPVDMSPLGNLTKLKYLKIADIIATDYGFLKKLPRLKELELIVGKQIGDMNDLAGLTNLEYLDITGIEAEDISVLKKLTGLKSLKLRASLLSDNEIAELKEALPGLKIEK